jgi:peptidoglycan/LPS O-acetylase OafA/YrhL
MASTDTRTLALPLIAVGLMIIGAIGPWVTVDRVDFSEGGLDSDGIITLVLALIAGIVLVVFRGREKRVHRIIVGVCGALALIIAIIDIADVNGTDLGFPGIEAAVGWGLWLTLIASALLLVGAVLAATRRP